MGAKEAQWVAMRIHTHRVRVRNLHMVTLESACTALTLQVCSCSPETCSYSAMCRRWVDDSYVSVQEGLMSLYKELPP